MKFYIFFIFFIASLILFPAYWVNAYLDPGVGSMLLQLVLAGIGGIFVLFRLFWRKLKGGRKKEVKRDNGENS